MFELTLQALYTGVLAGAYYALLALGLALVFGTMKVINLAHGELVLLAAYIAYTVETRLGLNPVAAIPVALVVVCACAAITYALVRRIRQDRELNSLILTFGLGIILTNAILMIWAPDVHSTNAPWFHQPVVIGGTLFSMSSELVAFAISLILCAALYWWLNHTWSGRAIRAVSSNPDAAKLMGVNPRRTEWLSFLIAGGLATFAGLCLYVSNVIFPSLGPHLTIKAFIITVLAGMGSVPGVLVGALLIGLSESLTVTFFSSSLRELSAMVLFLVVLIVLPSGLSGLFTGLKRWAKR